MRLLAVGLLILAWLGAHGTGDPPRTIGPSQASSAHIQHVVIIIQENRSVDNLFQGLPGADTQSYGYDQNGNQVPLQSQPLAPPYDLHHLHPDFLAAYNGGAMNGWNSEGCSKTCPTNAPYSYVQRSDVQKYYDLAEQYTFADRMFQTNQGPSFPAHEYLVSGASTISDGSNLSVSENPIIPGTGKQAGGCNAPPDTYVTLIDQYGNENQTTFPCFKRTSLMSEADQAGISWKYYGYTASYDTFWNAPDSLKDIQKSSDYSSHDIAPSEQVLTDIAAGNLAAITWVTPSLKASDHPSETNGTGPEWVASVVNAIGTSQYWNNTVIFIVWDDWGGWYDHVVPPQYNSYELGFRVPLIAISPYAKAGYVSHVQHEFGSILKFTEERFGLPSMGTTDARADDLSDCFDFGQSQRKFKQIPTKYGASYFLHQPIDTRPADY